MKYAYNTVAFEDFTGTEYSEDALTDLIYSGQNAAGVKNFDVVFGKGKKISLCMNAILFENENPSLDSQRNDISRYLEKYALQEIDHESDSHHVQVLPEGAASFRYKLDGKSLEQTDGMYCVPMKSRRKMKKQSEKWAEISKDLGFAETKADTISLMGCDTIKLCTKFMDIPQEDIEKYAAGKLIDGMEKHGANMMILAAKNKGHIFVSPGTTEIMLRNIDRGDAEFARKIAGAAEEEPEIGYSVPVEKWGDRLEHVGYGIGRFYSKYKIEIIAGSCLSLLPVGFSVFGASDASLAGYPLSDAIANGILAGAEVGALEGVFIGALLGIGYARDCIDSVREERKEEKRRAMEAFEERALQEPHYKESGACAFIVPEKCMINASRSSQKKTK